MLLKICLNFLISFPVLTICPCVSADVYQLKRNYIHPWKLLWKIFETSMKDPWNFYERSLKLLWKILETLMKDPWNPLETPLETGSKGLNHLWNTLVTSLKSLCGTHETFLNTSKILWNTFKISIHFNNFYDTPLWSLLHTPLKTLLKHPRKFLENPLKFFQHNP